MIGLDGRRQIARDNHAGRRRWLGRNDGRRHGGRRAALRRRRQRRGSLGRRGHRAGHGGGTTGRDLRGRQDLDSRRPWRGGRGRQRRRGQCRRAAPQHERHETSRCDGNAGAAGRHGCHVYALRATLPNTNRRRSGRRRRRLADVSFRDAGAGSSEHAGRIAAPQRPIGIAFGANGALRARVDAGRRRRITAERKAGPAGVAGIVQTTIGPEWTARAVLAGIPDVRRPGVAGPMHRIAGVPAGLVDARLPGAIVVGGTTPRQRGRVQSGADPDDDVVARVVEGAVVVPHQPLADLACAAVAIPRAGRRAGRSIRARRYVQIAIDALSAATFAGGGAGLPHRFRTDGGTTNHLNRTAAQRDALLGGCAVPLGLASHTRDERAGGAHRQPRRRSIGQRRRGVVIDTNCPGGTVRVDPTQSAAEPGSTSLHAQAVVGATQSLRRILRAGGAKRQRSCPRGYARQILRVARRTHRYRGNARFARHAQHVGSLLRCLSEHAAYLAVHLPAKSAQADPRAGRRHERRISAQLGGIRGRRALHANGTIGAVGAGARAAAGETPAAQVSTLILAGVGAILRLAGASHRQIFVGHETRQAQADVRGGGGAARARGRAQSQGAVLAGRTEGAAGGRAIPHGSRKTVAECVPEHVWRAGQHRSSRQRRWRDRGPALRGAGAGFRTESIPANPARAIGGRRAAGAQSPLLPGTD